MRILSTVLAGVLCLGLGAGDVDAAKKKSNSAPTAAQRKQLYAEGLKWCRKKYGAQLHYVRVEKYYGRWAAVCYHY